MTDTDLEYFKWSSERLMSLVEHEDARWTTVENKAVVAVTVALGFAAFALQEPAWKLRDLDRLSISLGGLGLLAVLASMCCGYLAVKTRPTKAFNADQSVAADVLARPAEERCRVIAQHLVATLIASRSAGNEKGRMAGYAQLLAFAGALFFVFFQLSVVR